MSRSILGIFLAVMLSIATSSYAAPWSGSETPFWFNHYMERDLQALPESAHVTQTVWTSSYFPLFEDSINFRWFSDGINGITSPNEYSPAEKYDQAYNSWTPPANFSTLRPFSRSNWQNFDQSYYSQLGPLATFVTEQRGNGIDRQIAIDRQNTGQFSGWEMQTWWGHCHAWAPAALVEKQACGPVTHNGVTFYAGDLEALLIFAYDRAWERGVWVGQACRDAPNNVARDELGRPTVSACGDTNPGSFHLIVTNFIGIKDRPLIYDRVNSEEIWNQPLVGYDIVSQTPVSAAQANSRFGLTDDTWSFNPEAASLVDVTMDIIWLTEAFPATTPTPPERYERTDRMTYILELDAAGDIIGGEYYGRSLGNVAPDYIWQSEQLVESYVPGLLDLQTVRGLIDQSCGAPAGLTPKPQVCPGSLNGSGTVACSVAAQECNNTWFTDRQGYDTAVCENGRWFAMHEPAGITAPTTPSNPTTPASSETCPNGIFANDTMYLNSVLVPNSCSATGQACPSQYFYALGRFDTAVCADGSWQLESAVGLVDNNANTGPSGVCGNSLVEVNEACDDGNDVDGDGCSRTCEFEMPDNSSSTATNDTCPSGIFDNGYMYLGSTFTANSCGNSGQICPSQYFYGSASFIDAVCSAGSWQRVGDSVTSAPACGNNTIESGEQCDDGNALAGDGCSSACQTETAQSALSACPNTVFTDGRMYDSNLNLTDNACSPEGVTCASSYFYSIPGHSPGICSGGVWVAD